MSENRETLKAEALKRADILNASAAWGTDWDAHLLTALVRCLDEDAAEIERLRAELHAAIDQAQEWRAELTAREASPRKVRNRKEWLVGLAKAIKEKGNE